MRFLNVFLVLLLLVLLESSKHVVGIAVQKSPNRHVRRMEREVNSDVAAKNIPETKCNLRFCCNQVPFIESPNGHKEIKHPLDVLEASSAEKCQNECSDSGICSGYFFNEKDSSCSLLGPKTWVVRGDGPSFRIKVVDCVESSIKYE